MIQETLTAKRAQKIRESYVKSVEQYLRKFATGRETMPIGQISVPDIETWFAARNEAPSSMQSNLGRLSTMFDVAWRRGYIDENPCQKVGRIKLDQTTPAILTVQQSAEALEFVQSEIPKFLPWLVLTLLAGIRPQEADQIKWDDIDLERGTVRIDAAASKVRRRRIVHLMPSAHAWLREAKQPGLATPLAHVTRRRCLRRLREKLGFSAWPADILRHTAATFWLAEWRDAGKVAHELGNSAGVLLRHYREIATREDAKQFTVIP